MKIRLAHTLGAVCIAAASALPLTTYAVNVMDLRAGQLMIGAESIRKNLDLTPNQLTLWQQASAKATGILRNRQSRRDKLQTELKRRLGAGTPDLRELDSQVASEAAASAADDQQLRELWLTVNDALTDQQRAQVIELLSSQLERIDADPGRGPGAGARDGGPRGGQGGQGGPGGGGRQRPGGMGGINIGAGAGS